MSMASRIVLVLVAVLAVAAFAVLQIRARSASGRRSRGPDPGRAGTPDWRVPPRRYAADVPRDEAPFGNQERSRPDWRYGYPPGRDPEHRERGSAS
jgi:hypothetical protein